MARDPSITARARTAGRASKGWWVVLDHRGAVISAIKTSGGHPCHEHGEKFNVMRTFAVPDRPDLSVERFDKDQRGMVADAAKIAAKQVAMAAHAGSTEIQAIVENAIAPLLVRMAAIEAKLNGEKNG